jgi:uncharacterized membrane protein YdjX (TVP38/TMEM64 family)
VAFLTISAGSTIGACCAFLLGKTILRGWVTERVGQYTIFKAIDSAIGKKGLYMVFLLRLSPVIPFNLLNYALVTKTHLLDKKKKLTFGISLLQNLQGITAVNFPSYALASWIGMAPGTFMYVYIPWATYNATQSAVKKANLVKVLGPKLCLSGTSTDSEEKKQNKINKQ